MVCSRAKLPKVKWQFSLDIMFQYLVYCIDYHYEEHEPNKPPEGVPENESHQDGKEYQHQILFSAQSRLSQAVFTPLHAQPYISKSINVFLGLWSHRTKSIIHPHSSCCVVTFLWISLSW